MTEKNKSTSDEITRLAVRGVAMAKNSTSINKKADINLALSSMAIAAQLPMSRAQKLLAMIRGLLQAE